MGVALPLVKSATQPLSVKLPAEKDVVPGMLAPRGSVSHKRAPPGEIGRRFVSYSLVGVDAPPVVELRR